MEENDEAREMDLMMKVSRLSKLLEIEAEAKEEEAVEKLRIYKQELEFDALLNSDRPLEADELRQKLADKAVELKDEADGLSVQAVKNVFSDLSALMAFAVVCFASRDDLRVMRGFFDEDREIFIAKKCHSFIKDFQENLALTVFREKCRI